MESNSVVHSLEESHPQFTFTAGDAFAWNHAQRTITYVPTEPAAYLLHELAHAMLGHATYTRDIELLKMERDAWDYAQRHLAGGSSIDIDDTTVALSLDSYRDWLHARSTCPTCGATGVQSDASHYTCPACATKWHVNEARSCMLRRTKK